MTKLKLNYYLTLYIQTEFNLSKNSIQTYYSSISKINIKKINKYDIFFLDKDNRNKFLAFKIYQMFTSIYLQNIYKIKLNEKNINAINVLPRKLSKEFLFKVRRINFKQFNIKYFNEVGYLFLVNVWLKNLKNICKYIKKKLDTVHFKKHRLYFLFFFKILNKYIKPNFNKLQLKGIYLVFRGKLGKGGNARKKVMCYKYGQFSLSNKLLSLNTQKWDVWTKTGTIGCTMRLFYKKIWQFI